MIFTLIFSDHLQSQSTLRTATFQKGQMSGTGLAYWLDWAYGPPPVPPLSLSMPDPVPTPSGLGPMLHAAWILE